MKVLWSDASACGGGCPDGTGLTRSERTSQFRFFFPVSGLNDHGLIAFARSTFQPRPVHDFHFATRVFDEASSLQSSGGNRNACTSRAQHVSQEFLG